MFDRLEVLSTPLQGVGKIKFEKDGPLQQLRDALLVFSFFLSLSLSLLANVFFFYFFPFSQREGDDSMSQWVFRSKPSRQPMIGMKHKRGHLLF